DLTNGLAGNVPAGVELVVGDVSDPEAVAGAVAGIEVVFHQAGLGSVQRSVEEPRRSDMVNAHGTLVVLDAARHAGVRRVVAASSSSVYGGVAPLPTREDHPVLPRSPYAVTKLVLEQYCRVFHELMGVETVALRYFNIYGPRQRVDSPYAAVIPLFVDALRSGRPPIIHGDGLQSRDFTFVADAVAANLLAAEAPVERCGGKVYNVAGGLQHTLLDLLAAIAKILGVDAAAEHTDPRPGDVRHSCADVSAIRRDLGYEAKVSLDEGLRLTLADTDG
ncbi:MAG: NAD-dependent epimerase/dehydratase family protein, partial [Acidimicrobiia bacterium]